MALFTLERQTICALIHSRMRFVSSYRDAVQGAKVLQSRMVFALLYRTFDTLIDVAHICYLLFRFH